MNTSCLSITKRHCVSLQPAQVDEHALALDHLAPRSLTISSVCRLRCPRADTCICFRRNVSGCLPPLDSQPASVVGYVSRHRQDREREKTSQTVTPCNQSKTLFLGSRKPEILLIRLMKLVLLLVTAIRGVPVMDRVSFRARQSLPTHVLRRKYFETSSSSQHVQDKREESVGLIRL